MNQVFKAADRGLISSPRSDALSRGEIKEAGTVADRNKKPLTENLWIKYQNKRIKVWVGDLKNGKRDRRKILTVAGALIVLFALCGLIFTFLEYHRSDSIYGKAEKEYVTVPSQTDVSIGQASEKAGDGNGTGGNAGNDSIGGTETADDPAVMQRPWYELVSVELEGLQAAYPDVAGWLYFENESISYPVMYSGDNEKYLRTAYTGKQATAGSIFLDGEGSGDFSDLHTLIYGHNMKNLSMFGRLRYYRTEKDYYDGHKYFQIFTGGYIYRYEIFAYGQIPADSSIYYVYGAEPDTESFKTLIKDLKKISMQDTGIEVGPSDHIITLSTCTGDGNVRMIVSAVRVDEYKR